MRLDYQNLLKSTPLALLARSNPDQILLCFFFSRNIKLRGMLEYVYAGLWEDILIVKV